jgi:hypothetical protein
MTKLKPGWVKTDIPKRIKIKLWRLMRDNPTYRSWEEAIVGKSSTSAQDNLFASDELKYIKMGSDTYKALKYEILHMPAEEVLNLPPDLQSWVKQLRPELESVPYDKATLNTCFAGAISGIDWEAEPYVFVPAEADDLLSALFYALRDEESQAFYLDPKVEGQLTEELRGKIVFFPLPADKAVNYLECRKVLNGLRLSEEGIQALREEADRVRRSLIID